MADSRLLAHRRDWAEEALLAYANTLRDWNAPDDEHTRLTLRKMVEGVIAEAVPE